MAASTAFIVNHKQAVKGDAAALERQLAAAWDLVCEPAGLDCFQYKIPTPLPPPSGKSHFRLMVEAPQLLAQNEARAPAEWRDDPMWQVVRAIAAADRYDARAHLDAADAFGKAGHPDRALIAIAGAEYWRAALWEEPFPQLAQTAELLTRQSGWSEIADVIADTIAAAKRATK
jgi:hypothetical protein